MDRRVRIGLFVVAGILLLYLGLAWVNTSGVFAPPRKQYSAKFSHVSGLQVNDPVTLYGVQVGRVEALHLKDDGVRVRFWVHDSLALPNGTAAQVMMRELFGGKQLALLWGSGPGAVAPGSTLLGRKTFDVPLAIAEFGEVLEGFSTDNLQQLAHNFLTLSERFVRLTDSLKPGRLEKILTHVEATLGQAENTFSALNQSGLVDSAVVLAGELRGTVADLQSTLASAAVFLESAQGLPKTAADALRQLETSLTDASALVDRFTPLLNALNQQEGFVGRLVYDEALNRQLNALLEELQHLAEKVAHDAAVFNVRFGKPSEKRTQRSH